MRQELDEVRDNPEKYEKLVIDYAVTHERETVYFHESSGRFSRDGYSVHGMDEENAMFSLPVDSLIHIHYTTPGIKPKRVIGLVLLAVLVVGMIGVLTGPPESTPIPWGGDPADPDYSSSIQKSR